VDGCSFVPASNYNVGCGVRIAGNDNQLTAGMLGLEDRIMFKAVQTSGDRNLISGNQFTEIWDQAMIIGAGYYNRVVNNAAYDNLNMLVNGECESAVAPHVEGDGPSEVNCTFLRSSVQSYQGTYSFRQTVTAGGTDADHRFVSDASGSSLHTIVSGNNYRLRGRVYVPSVGGPAASEAKLMISYYDATWVNTIISASVQDAWEALDTGEVAIPSTASGFLAVTRIASTAASGELVYWDKLILTPIGRHNQYQQQFFDSGMYTQMG
jgi:hypothetical protein